MEDVQAHTRNRPVQSREYKIMLQAKCFQGGRRIVRHTAQRWWSACAALLITKGMQATSPFDHAKPARLIRFYDTPDRLLAQRGYLVRERGSAQHPAQHEVTLKFRHLDRYVAQDRDMSTAEAGEIKFEEDIKPVFAKHIAPFSSLYSVSATQALPHAVCLDRLGLLMRLYPGLGAQIDPPGETHKKLEIVNHITTYEQVLTGASFALEPAGHLRAECALILWYRYDAATQHVVKHKQPVLVEFSFRYRGADAHEPYAGPEAQRAYEVFCALTELRAWIEKSTKHPATKTQFIFA